jgi:hypothetical protein
MTTTTATKPKTRADTSKMSFEEYCREVFDPKTVFSSRSR